MEGTKNKFKEDSQAKKLIEEIAGLKKKFDVIIDHMKSVETWMLPDHTIAFISPGIVEITGYPAEDFIKDAGLINTIIHPDDLADYIQFFSEKCENQLPVEIELRFVGRSGKISWIHTRITKIYDDQGNFGGFRTSMTDITDRKAAELVLRNSYKRLEELEEKYRIISENTYDMERWVLPDKTLAYISPSCERITGYSREEFMEIPDLMMKIIHHDDRAWFEEIREQAFISEASIGKNVRIITKKGETRWIGIESQKVTGKNGKDLGIRTSSRDVTELQETELRLECALSEVQELKSKLEQENLYLRETFLPVKATDGIITDSPLMLDVLKKIKQVAQTDSPVLIYGETGTGKELIAQAIHNGSKRQKRVMIKVNCAALPAPLIESELFGRERGAYTGALSSQVGRFELADKSTIFLDEIGELPPEIQVKLLRVIQFGEFEMLGSPSTRKVDVRIIAATNKDLTKALSDGLFRKDLYYRLNVFPVNLPPLRERKEDIPLLAWSFVDEIANNSGKRIDKISSRGMNMLLKHSWPGNIRELRNVIEYSIILAQGPVLEIVMQETEPESSESENLDIEQRRHIKKVMNQTGWRIRGKGGAAEKLGMKESTLRFRMKKLGIRHP